MNDLKIFKNNSAGTITRKSKNEQIKSLIEELLPILDLKNKNELIGLLEGMRFNLLSKTQQNEQ